MEGITKRIVMAEFRTEAVKLVVEQGQSAAARRPNIFYQKLYNWVALAKAGKLGSVDTKRISPVSPLEAENSRLKKEVAVLREERDILIA
jgi:transposase